MAVNNIEGSAQQMNMPVENRAAEESRSAGRAVEEQNIRAARTDLDTGSARAARQAFEVNITPEARDRLQARAAESGQEETPPGAASGSEEGQGQTVNQQQESRRIINIVA
ncbi:MAG: hypothetical protein R6V41_01105 [Desulfobacteraceae bacterium]